MKISNLTH
jgi:hypothetical protein